MDEKITLTPEKVSQLECALRQNGFTEEDFKILCSARFLQKIWRNLHPKNKDKTYYELFPRPQPERKWSRELYEIFGDGFAERDNI